MEISSKDMNAYMKERWAKRRQNAVDFLGGRCVVCGTTEGLEFDHVVPETKTTSIARASSFSESRFWEEVSKCQLLCKQHHIEKSKVDNGVPHGGGKSGKYINRKPCTCQPCRDKRKEYLKQFRKTTK